MFSIDTDLWDDSQKMSAVDNANLTRPFTEDEVKHALFSMDRNRAPGPDNIPIEFFQHCWEFVKKDIMHIFDDFFEGKLDVQRLNYGVITLIPNLSDAKSINQFRPMCLLRCMYKWITKTLGIRTDPFAPMIFSPQQNAFIKNRNIS